MLKKTAIFLLLVFTVQAISVPASASIDFPDLAAFSAILVEKDSGVILYDNNMNQRHPADALAKVMTLLIAAYAVENDEISDNELITMTDSAWHDIHDNSTTQNIKPEEIMTFIDLMYSAYIGNANEACNMIALRVAGNINAFVSMMNDKATELGAVNTRFANPHGQYSEAQYTTAYDQYIIFNEAMKSSLFSEISSSFRHITESTDEADARTLTNSNLLLNQGSRYFLRSCISGRDSATYEGGHSFIAYAEEEGLSLISVILGSDEQILEDESVNMRHFSETLRLFQWGFTQFAWRDILKTTDLLTRVPILHGSGADFVNARPEASLSLLLNNSVSNDSFTRSITIFYDDDDPLIAPVSAGDVLGEIVVSRDGIVYAKMALVANTNIDLNGFEYIRRQIIQMLSTYTARYIIIILVVLLVLYIALVIRYNILRANRLRKIKNARNDIIRERNQNFRD